MWILDCVVRLGRLLSARLAPKNMTLGMWTAILLCAAAAWVSMALLVARTDPMQDPTHLM